MNVNAMSGTHDVSKKLQELRTIFAYAREQATTLKFGAWEHRRLPIIPEAKAELARRLPNTVESRTMENN